MLNDISKCGLISVATKLNIKMVTTITEKSKTGPAPVSSASIIEPFAETELWMPGLMGGITEIAAGLHAVFEDVAGSTRSFTVQCQARA